MLADCPKAAALTDIPVSDCPFKIDQVLKMGFQRYQPVGASTFKATTPIGALASWTAARAALDGKKVVISPICDSLEIPSSEAVTEGGGDNSTPFGLQLYLGENSITVTGQFRNLDKEQIRAMRKLSGESVASLGAAALGVYMFNVNKAVVHSTESDVETSDAVAIPIFNFRLGTTGSGGYNQDNKTPFSFSLKPDWDERMTITPLLFDALSQL